MIDRQARRELALLSRRFLAGRITNQEFDDKGDALALEAEDEAIFRIFYEIWLLYDDFRIQRFGTEIIFGKPERRVIARWILFLQNELEFEWRDQPLRHKLQRILAARCRWISAPEPFPQGDKEVWPFFRRVDFEQALSHPKLLHGAQ